jgi:hypothetical protein
MASEILGLFQTPEQYQAAQDEAMRSRFMQAAQLTPLQQASLGYQQAGYQAGQAIGGALGGEDPQLKLIAQRQALLGQLDQSNPESYLQVAQLAARAGDPQMAMALTDYGRQMATSIATQRKAIAEAQKVELTLEQEAKLRDELSRLPPGATDADILGVVTKYGSADKVIAALQASTDKAAQREFLASQQQERLAQQAQLAKYALEQKTQLAKDALEQKAELARRDNEARLERARESNATRAEIARITAEGRAQQNAIANAIRLQTLQLRQEAATEKKVAAERQQQGIVQSFETAIDTLDTISKHPGKKAAVGFGGAQLSMIPGTDAAGFAAQLETFKAQTFLPQVQALKGMGALSDAEGRKLEAAVGALSQSMKLSEFDSQVGKIKSYLQAAKARVSQGLKTPMPEPAQPSKAIKFSDLP